jgi:hypothetical protein
MISSLVILISVFVNGVPTTYSRECTDWACVDKVVSASRARPEVTRVRVFNGEPAKFGPGSDNYTTRPLADYQKG